MFTRALTTLSDWCAALRDLQAEWSKHRQTERREAPHFSIFSILSVGHLELAHSAFLAELLKPYGSHAQGGLFLKAFLRQLSSLDGLPDATGATLERASNDVCDDGWFVNRELSAAGRRLDILVSTRKYSGMLLAIENKFLSEDHEGQLSAYLQWLDGQADYRHRLLLYLTPSGSKPIRPTGREHCISYKQVLDVLKATCDKIEATRVKGIVSQYLRTVQGYLPMSEGEQDDVITSLLCEPRHLRVVLDIAERANKVKERLAEKFWQMIAQEFDTELMRSGLIKGWKVEREPGEQNSPLGKWYGVRMRPRQEKWCGVGVLLDKRGSCFYVSVFCSNAEVISSGIRQADNIRRGLRPSSSPSSFGWEAIADGNIDNEFFMAIADADTATTATKARHCVRKAMEVFDSRRTDIEGLNQLVAGNAIESAP